MKRTVLAMLVVASVTIVWISFRPGDEPRSSDTNPQLQTQAVVWVSNEATQEQPRTTTQAQKKKRQPQRPNTPAESTPEEVVPDGFANLSNGDSYDDFASVVQTSDGTFYAAYAAYYDAHDQIRLHKRLPNGNWSTRTHVPLVRARADIWMPQLAVDKNDKVWVIWSEQTELTDTRSGNWDLYARALQVTAGGEEQWGPIARLTRDPKPDINHHVVSDEQGNIHVVWQGHKNNNGDVLYCRFDGEQWSSPLAVTSDDGADWYPQAAVDKDGTVWIAFDSYRRGDYDVYLASVNGDQVGEVIPIAASDYYEAHASIACTKDGRVWVAWEQGGWNWGKDQGYWLREQGQNVGSTLGSTRTVHVAARDGDSLWATPAVTEALRGSDIRNTAMPGLAADGQGRLWLRFRGQKTAGMNRQGRRYWTEQVMQLSSDGWTAPMELPQSTGRITVFSRQITSADNELVVAYSGDLRGPANYHQPIHDQVLVAVVPAPPGVVELPELVPYRPPAPPDDAPAWDRSREQQQVAAARSYRVDVNGTSLQIVRGDLHRHTELSWDVGPGNDGSYLDFYRYMIDVAEMDFGGLTDHQGGGHYAYHWWLTEKSSDLYYLAPRFVPLYGYERSARFPNGHRNVFHSYRGVPVFAFQLTTNQRGVFPGVGSGALVENDTKLLYEYLRSTGGIAISHTSGTNSMGTDWRDNDPEIEPVVEIYQGARNSYEVVGAPRVHDIANRPPNQAPGGFQEAGMVWNALAKGYRLGTTASSDHGSTHISYSMVYTPANDRQSILDAIRKRNTYGATDNLIVEFWANGHFMGSEFETAELPALTLKVQSTAAVARVDLIRNNRYIYNTSPGSQEFEIQYTDMEPAEGLNYYYARILQDDGEIAWISPIWIHVK